MFEPSRQYFHTGKYTDDYGRVRTYKQEYDPHEVVEFKAKKVLDNMNTYLTSHSQDKHPAIITLAARDLADVFEIPEPQTMSEKLDLVEKAKSIPRDDVQRYMPAVAGIGGGIAGMVAGGKLAQRISKNPHLLNAGLTLGGLTGLVGSAFGVNKALEGYYNKADAKQLDARNKYLERIALG